MNKKLILNKKMDIIQYQGITYNLPSKMNLRNDAINKYNAFGKVQLLAGELGLEMGNDKSFGCSGCKYTSRFMESLLNVVGGQNVSVFEGTDKKCKYDNKDEPQWLSYFYRERKIIKNIFGEIGFGARMNPCVADTALLKVLIELNVFKEFEVKTELDVKIFPYIRDVNRKNEKQYIKLYKEHFKN